MLSSHLPKIFQQSSPIKLKAKTFYEFLPYILFAHFLGKLFCTFFIRFVVCMCYLIPLLNKSKIIAFSNCSVPRTMGYGRSVTLCATTPRLCASECRSCLGCWKEASVNSHGTFPGAHLTKYIWWKHFQTHGSVGLGHVPGNLGHSCHHLLQVEKPK